MASIIGAYLGEDLNSVSIAGIMLMLVSIVFMSLRFDRRKTT